MTLHLIGQETCHCSREDISRDRKVPFCLLIQVPKRDIGVALVYLDDGMSTVAVKVQTKGPYLTNTLSRRPLRPKTPTFSTQRLATPAMASPTLSSYSSRLISDSASGAGAGFSGSATPITSITSLCDRIMSLLILLVSGLTGRPLLSYCWVVPEVSLFCSSSRSTTSSYGERP